MIEIRCIIAWLHIGSGVREDLDHPSLLWVGKLGIEDLRIILAPTHVTARGGSIGSLEMPHSSTERHPRREIEVLFCFFVQ